MEELRPFAELPGAGAAGGLGAALAALGAELLPGNELVLEAVGFEGRLAGAALAVTGEGTVDATSASGKVPGAVAVACRSAEVPCVVFGGRVVGGVEALVELGARVVELSGQPERAREDLEELGAELGRSAVSLEA
jgi:glycerate kinase